MSDRITVSSADFIRNIGQWQNEALKRPVVITHHGRDRLVLAAAEKFEMSDDGVSADELVVLRSKLAAVSESITDGHLSFTSDRRLIRANAVIEMLLGLARPDLIGRTLKEVLPEPAASCLDERVERTIRSGRKDDFDLAIKERHFLVTVFPYAGGAGALLRNVTEEHELRRRVEEGEALLKALGQCAHASNITLSADGLIEGADQKLAAWTGYSASELTGCSVVDLFPASERAEAAVLVQGALRNAQPASIAAGLVRKNGGEIAGLFSIAPTIADGVVRGAVAVFITSPTLDENRNAA